MKIFIIFLLFLLGCEPTEQQKSVASKACSNFVLEKSDLKYCGEANVFDIYSKNGRIVVEVGYKNGCTGEDSYSIRLCVYDEEKQTVLLPGLLDQNDWRKN